MAVDGDDTSVQGLRNVSGTRQPYEDDGPEREELPPLVRARDRGRAWWWCASLATTFGLLCSLAEWGWQGTVTGVVSIGVFAGTIATAAWVGDGLRALRRILRLSVVAAMVGTAAAGLVAVFELTGLVVVLVLAATSPVVRMLFRALRWPTAETAPVVPHSAPPKDLASSCVEIAPESWSTSPTGDLSLLDDDALCLAWRRSFLLLQGTRSAADRLVIVEQRQHYLDELHRRSPEGLTTWLTSGGRASGNPLPYLRKDPPPTG